MCQSLNALVKTLQSKDFVHLRGYFYNISEELFKKLIEKGYFLYGVLDSFREIEGLLSPYGNDWKNSLTGSIDSVTQEFD